MNYLSSSLQFGILFGFIVNPILFLFDALILEQRQRTGKRTMRWKAKRRMNGRIIAVLWLGRRIRSDWLEERERKCKSILVFLFHSTLYITLFQYIQTALCLHLNTTLCLHPRNRYHPIVQQNQSYNNASRITQSTQPHHRPETTQTADQQWSNT